MLQSNEKHLTEVCFEQISVNEGSMTTLVQKSHNIDKVATIKPFIYNECFQMTPKKAPPATQ